MTRLPPTSILIIAFAVLTCGALPTLVLPQENTVVEETFARVRELRAQGDFDQAITLLSEVIREHRQSEQVLRKAYNDLVFTYLSKRKNTSDVAEQDSLNTDLIGCARDALTQFPDLEAATPEYPSDVNLVYQTLRTLMFGRVEVTSNADSSRVFMRAEGDATEDLYRGITPLAIPYVPVGDYLVTITCSGYKDRVVPLNVGPSALVQREVTLSKERTKKWWLTRVVAPVTASAAAIVAIIVGAQDDTPTETSKPLDGPPPPPAGQ